ncbi:MAG: Radical SAM domain protein [candidate division TA06 bacterium 32_111]|uniref:Radical SAM domain protein n=2 Tax=Bacteria candidate phyla TaxID=1783234 RepID=A0A117M6N6_UNCT6|nr:MAG: Radical SAM domain protein [candidate division TA06 bacterium 32_111]KUK87341.1 MAG: Radical SAM domain protein [candidate division TA06 bacterium 34_109]HAF07826.1 radical SAM protein [candidate division WOR-3 bacterium]HCP17344.1 radical SAM protein [candidate division WOR-3 bacterium]
MKIVLKNEIKRVSSVYIVETFDGNKIESVDVEPKISKKCYEKWVLILSTQIGCPVGCLFCDSGYKYIRNLTYKELIHQVEFMINERKIDPKRFKKFKVQFARMGEPSFNDNVLEVMKNLKEKYPNYIPCISTVFPKNRRRWFNDLLLIKDIFIDFQLQFSIYSTDEIERDKLIPIEKEDFYFLNEYGKSFLSKGKRKLVLNFPINEKNEISSEKISKIFDRNSFLVKLTPVNPTYNAIKNGLFDLSYKRMEEIKKDLNERGFDVIISIGDPKENVVGSNCGQSILNLLLT